MLLVLILWFVNMYQCEFKPLCTHNQVFVKNWYFSDGWGYRPCVNGGFSHWSWILLKTMAELEISENSGFSHHVWMGKTCFLHCHMCFFGFLISWWLPIFLMSFWQHYPRLFKRIMWTELLLNTEEENIYIFTPCVYQAWYVGLVYPSYCVTRFLILWSNKKWMVYMNLY